MGRTLPPKCVRSLSYLVSSTECETRRKWEKAILFDVSSASRRQKVPDREDRPTLGPNLEIRISESLGARGMEKRRKLLEGKRAEVLS